jgi:hypothetical protein
MTHMTDLIILGAGLHAVAIDEKQRVERIGWRDRLPARLTVSCSAAIRTASAVQ